MTRNQYPSLWGLNPASAYVEAVDHALRSKHRHATAHSKFSRKQAPARNRATSASFFERLTTSWMTPRHAALALGLVVVSGVSVAGMMV